MGRKPTGVRGFLTRHRQQREPGLLADRYPTADGGMVDRDAMTLADLRFNRHRLAMEAFESFRRADALNRWWRRRKPVPAGHANRPD